MPALLCYAWAAPCTVVGLALASLALPGGRLTLVEGIVEADGPLLRWALTHAVPLPGGAAAMTFGHVVVGRDRRALDATRAHERVHVRQYERWGPFFLPAYLLASAWAFLCGRDAYCDNVFEREARRLA